jgi:hypothetical protein
MKKKRAVISGIMDTIVGLFLLAATSAVPSVTASGECVDIDCLKERLRQICETDPKPEYLDCENILRCIDTGDCEGRMYVVPTGAPPRNPAG